MIGWRPTKRAFNLGQTASDSWPVGLGRWHRRTYTDHVSVHFDTIDPDRSLWFMLLHGVVDVIPWLLRGRPR